MEDDDDGEISSAFVCEDITDQLLMRMKKDGFGCFDPDPVGDYENSSGHGVFGSASQLVCILREKNWVRRLGEAGREQVVSEMRTKAPAVVIQYSQM